MLNFEYDPVRTGRPEPNIRFSHFPCQGRKEEGKKAIEHKTQT